MSKNSFVHSGVSSHPVSLLFIRAVRWTLLVVFHVGAVTDGGHLIRTLLVDHPCWLLPLHPVVKPASCHEDGRVHLGLYHTHRWRASIPWTRPRCATERLPFGLWVLRVEWQVDGDRFEDLNTVVYRLHLALAAGVARQRRPEETHRFNIYICRALLCFIVFYCIL